MYCSNNLNISTDSQSGLVDVRPESQGVNKNIYYSMPPPPMTIPGNCGTYFTIPPPSFSTNTNNLNKFCNQSQELTTFNTQYCETFPNVNKFVSKENFDVQKHTSKLPFACINVTSIKRDFMKCSLLMKEFERLFNFLQVFRKTLSKNDWLERCAEIKCKQEEIASILNKYEDVEYFNAVHRAVKKCFKKRIYRKRKKIEWQELKINRKTFREKEHRRIDLWLEKMKEQVEKARRQEHVKREADLVLSEVTTKKSEAKRYINLLNTLTKLRNSRVQQLTSSGNFVSDSETNSFTQVIDKLKKLWVDQLKEYNFEEQGLRVMLNDAEIERVNIEAKVTKQIHSKWNELLFGEGTNKNNTVPNNIDELIAIRYEWDRFITNDDETCLSSRIPVGWILPVGPNSSNWSSFIKN